MATELTTQQKWDLLFSWAQTMANHAKSKDYSHLQQDIEEITHALNLLKADSDAQRRS